MCAQSYWRYRNSGLNLSVNHISNLFAQNSLKFDGDQNKGSLSFHSSMKTDDLVGSDATMEISWEKVDPTKYHQGLKVKETIRMFSSINVIATKKESKWHLSHEFTYWHGNRQQFKNKRYFPTNIIHGILYCELTHRVFEVHTSCYSNVFPQYEQAALDVMFSLQCHG